MSYPKLEKVESGLYKILTGMDDDGNPVYLMEGNKLRYRVRVQNGTKPHPSDPTKSVKNMRTATVTGETAARAKLKEFKDAKDAGTFTAPTKERFSAYLQRWLKEKRMELRPRTYHDYSNIIRRYIEHPKKDVPRIGYAYVDKLHRESFQTLYNHLWEVERLSPRTIRYLHSILRQSLKHAVLTGVRGTNPTDGVRLPKYPFGANPEDMEDDGEAKKWRAMDKDQRKAFMEAARDDRYYALFAVLLTAGLRPAEAVALEWCDVDLEKGRVTVRQALTRRGLPDGQSWAVKPPKTKKARRTVDIPVVTVQALKEWRPKQKRERLKLGAEYQKHKQDFAFTTEFGSPLDAGRLSTRNFRRVCKQAGLGVMREKPESGAPGPRGLGLFRPAFRLYDLRHSHATELLEAGVPVKIVSERLGHASVTLTLDTYSHVLPGMQAGAVAALDAVYGT